MTKKKVILWIVLISLIFTNIKPCLAAGFSGVGSLSDNYGNNKDEPGEDNPDPDKEKNGFKWSGKWENPKDSGGKRYKSQYLSKETAGAAITIDIYDQENISLIPKVIQFPTDKFFKAGTWVGVNVTETRTATWELSDIVYAEVKKRYTCNYTVSDYDKSCEPKSVTKTVEGIDRTTCIDVYGGAYHGNKCTYTTTNNECTESWTTYTAQTKSPLQDYHATYTCPSTHKETRDGEYLTFNFVSQGTPEEITKPVLNPPSGWVESSTESDIITKLRTRAFGNVSNASGVVKYATNDNFPIVYSSINGIGQDYNDSGFAKVGSVSRDFLYYPKNVCMDTTTAKVSYKNENCTENEVKIPNKTAKDDKTYWHYFIPLNAKSSSIFDIEVIRNGTENYSPEACVDFMKKFAQGGEREGDKYENYITPADTSKTFDGKYNEYHVNPKNSNDWKVMTESEDESLRGCQISMKVIIPIEQRFYNETDDEKKFKGFNFYYKPIPTNLSEATNVADKVFPNGITDDSLWKDWYDKTKKDETVYPNLKNEDITYIAHINGNVNTIRKHNKEVSYMSWKDMFADGHSSFIKNNSDNIFERIGPANFYKLGCGPANINEENSDGTINYLHQGWCKQ